eukprot:TRINITY_DN1798_c0_g1_i1.p1 TRINITY_DN1798_c0_g1~~TRINITY_DN1798_c0_g1_i1.p1  ORF type:complete len:540 (-),score=130.49 TRINITY_DN1798_c0_g1_i1:116-1735(-)
MLGLNDMLKEGTKHLVGKDEALLKNIEACKKFSEITRTSFGPNGRNKMVVNHLEKLFVTNDAATIMKELDVVHAAARMLVLAAQMQESEVGDGTNLVVILAGELLKQAESLLQIGLHPSEIIAGYEKAGKKALEDLETLVVHKLDDVRDEAKVTHCLKTVLSSKQYGYEDLLAPMIAKACIQVCPKNAKNFNVDNVRVTKILGMGVSDSQVLKGFVLPRPAEGTIKHVTDAKIAVFSAGIDIGKTETKGTVKITNAEELLNFNKGEEKAMEEFIHGVAEAGVKVLVSGSTISELALHYIERYNMMVVKIPSKFQLRRVCKTVGATPLVKFGVPTAEELGHCDVVTVEEIGSTRVTIFRQDGEDSQVSTIVVRGSTDNIMDDVERAIDDGVNVYKAMCRDPRFVAGAGASEVEIARRVSTFGDGVSGLDQYAIQHFAQAFEIIPRTLAENAGLQANKVVSNLYAAHQKGHADFGLNVETGEVASSTSLGFLDLLGTKTYAIRLATNTAITVLRVDQIIMSKPAGGPKPPKQGPMDGGDDF